MGGVACGLGGYQVLDQNSHVEKTFTGLPTHTMLQVQLTYTRVDQLATGLLYVDGTEAWRRSFNYMESGAVASCGSGGHSVNNEIQDRVDITFTHSSSSVTIRAAAAGNQGWFGIQSVRIITGTDLPAA